MAKKETSSRLVTNRRARYLYEVLETFEAGMKLTGTEIKSLRLGGGNLDGSFARIVHGDLYLLSASIAPFEYGGVYNHEENRERKLLMHKKEILLLKQKMQEKGLTLIPLSIYLKRGVAKVEIALAKGKRGPDKRKAIQEKEEKRRIQSLIKKHR